MSIWDQFFQLREEFLRNGDEERLRLTYPHSDGFACQETDPPSADIEQLEGHDDDQHVQCTAHDRLGYEQGDDQARLRFAREQLEPRGELTLRALVREPQPSLDVDRSQREGCGEIRNGAEREDHADISSCHEDAGDQRTDQRPEPLGQCVAPMSRRLTPATASVGPIGSSLPRPGLPRQYFP